MRKSKRKLLMPSQIPAREIRQVSRSLGALLD
jgi:hypothetical protein